jgi:heme/copper-type cytochrome/quinol oxidase subunit 1
MLRSPGPPHLVDVKHLEHEPRVTRSGRPRPFIASGFLSPGGAADFGWFAYTPLSDAVRSPGVGGDLWDAGLIVAGLRTILGGVNFITTIICLRAPGMTMFRMPIS